MPFDSLGVNPTREMDLRILRQIQEILRHRRNWTRFTVGSPYPDDEGPRCLIGWVWVTARPDGDAYGRTIERLSYGGSSPVVFNDSNIFGLWGVRWLVRRAIRRLEAEA
jgi:hypothetical protein